MTQAEFANHHLKDVLQAPAFRRSAGLSLLLKRLVEPVLAGSDSPIKEQILGIEIFKRPPDWNPQTDSIVRVEVGRLRNQLKLYYAGLEQPPDVRFEIPRGSYVAKCILRKRPSQEISHAYGQSGGTISDPASTFSSGERLSQPRVQLRRLTYERGDITNAVFTPDGENIVFSARWRGEAVCIHSQRIGQKYSRPLGLPSGEVRDVSGTGQLLFTLGESSMGTLAQADSSGGPWHEIVERVTDAVWLADNRTIAAARIEGGSMQVELPLGKPIHTLASNQSRIRLSADPSGRQVAFVDSSLGSVDFCTADRAGQVRSISKGWRVTGGVHWLAPNRLIVSGTRRGSPSIHILDLEGNEQSFYSTPDVWNLHDCTVGGRVLASRVNSRLDIAFRTSSMAAEGHLYAMPSTRLVGITPDARFAVLLDLLADGPISDEGPVRNSPVLLAALPSGQPAQIAEGCLPQVAPDGMAVICLERGEVENAVLVTPIPCGLPRRYLLPHGPRYHSAEFISGDERFLLYVLQDNGDLKSHTFHPISGDMTPLPGDHRITLVRPCGKWGVIPRGPDLRLANLETGEVRRICALRPGWVPIRWSKNGNELFVFEPGNDYATAQIVRVNIDTGEQWPLHTLHPTDSVGVYMSPWVDVTPDGRAYAYTYQQDLSDLYVLEGLI